MFEAAIPKDEGGCLINDLNCWICYSINRQYVMTPDL